MNFSVFNVYYLNFSYLQYKKIKPIMSYTDKMLRDDALKGKVIVVTGGGSGLGKAMTSISQTGRTSSYYVKRH
jgi:dihydroxyacetone kinase